MRLIELGLVTLLFAGSLSASITTTNPLGKFFAISITVATALGIVGILYEDIEAHRNTKQSRGIKI